MQDGRFEPEFYRSLTEGQVSASDLASDLDTDPADPAIVRLWLIALVVIIALCVMKLA